MIMANLEESMSMRKKEGLVVRSSRKGSYFKSIDKGKSDKLYMRNESIKNSIRYH